MWACAGEAPVRSLLEVRHISVSIDRPRQRGSEVTFTLFRQPGDSDKKFAEDTRWVEKDLRLLKSLLEH
jgi:hypothetical protein